MGEMDTSKAVSLMESFWTFSYAEELIKTMISVYRKECEGCRNGWQSQKDHMCLDVTNRYQLECYFDRIVKLIDEKNVLDRWEKHTTPLNLTPSLLHLYRLKIYCEDWRQVDMKTDYWETSMVDTVLRILQLETRFH